MGDTDEGKPAQTNALAALFFARLYGATGNQAHRDAALSTIGWLDAALFDPDRNLYRWSVRYERPDAKAGGPIQSQRTSTTTRASRSRRSWPSRSSTATPDRIARAKAIGDAMHTAFWSRDRGGYNLEAGVEQVYTSYAAWTSLGHLALYAQDGEERWLQMAQANAKAIAAQRRPSRTAATPCATTPASTGARRAAAAGAPAGPPTTPVTRPPRPGRSTSRRRWPGASRSSAERATARIVGRASPAGRSAPSRRRRPT